MENIVSKRLEAMRNNPRGDWKISDVDALCKEFNMLRTRFGWRDTLQGGSRQNADEIDHPFQTPHKACIYQETGIFCGCLEQTDMNINDYAIIVEPLAAEDGGGFVATVPDLPGCMSDGETPQDALANVEDAIRAWIEAAQELGHAIPQPTRRFAMMA